MDKADLLRKNSNVINLALDGLIYGLVSDAAMYLSLAAFALLFGGPAPLLVLGAGSRRLWAGTGKIVRQESSVKDRKPM